MLLQVRENEISLRKLSRGTAHLRTCEGTLDMMHPDYVRSIQTQVPNLMASNSNRATSTWQPVNILSY